MSLVPCREREVKGHKRSSEVGSAAFNVLHELHGVRKSTGDHREVSMRSGVSRGRAGQPGSRSFSAVDGSEFGSQVFDRLRRHCAPQRSDGATGRA